MKRLFCAIVAIAALWLAGCGNADYTVVVANVTSKTVLYRFDGSDETLPGLESVSFTVKEFTQPPSNITDEQGIASIIMTNWQGEKYTFDNAEKLTLQVTNTLPFSVTISAGKYIDSGDADKPLELNIGEAGSDTAIKTDALIYTRKPGFKSNVRVVIDWDIIKDDPCADCECGCADGEEADDSECLCMHKSDTYTMRVIIR